MLATENPIEYEGTYPLPEAQLDRFLFKILIAYPGFDEASCRSSRNWQAGLQRAQAGSREFRRDRRPDGHPALPRAVRDMRVEPGVQDYLVEPGAANARTSQVSFGAQARARRWPCCWQEGPGRDSRARLRDPG